MAVAASDAASPRLGDLPFPVVHLPLALLFAGLFLARTGRAAALVAAAFLAAGMARALAIGGAPGAALGGHALDLLEAGLLAAALRRWGLRGVPFRSVADLAAFAGLAVALPMAVGALAAGLGAAPPLRAPFDAAAPLAFWRDWVLVSAGAYLGAGAALAALGRTGARRARGLAARRPWELAAAVLALLLALAHDFGAAPGPATAPVLIFPALLWLAWRFRRPGAALGALLTALAAPHLAAAGFGPAWLAAPADQAGALQLSVAAAALAAFAVAALAHGALRRERALRLALARAERRARDRAAFLATVNHEMRTPLNGVLGFTELMKAELDGALSPRHRGFVAAVDQSARRLLAMVEEFLDLSRLQAGLFRVDPAEVRPAEIAAAAFAELAGLAERGGVRLVNDAAPDFTLTASPAGLRHALTNLIANALRHTPAGGEVRVRAFAAGAERVVEVADTGPGFPPGARAARQGRDRGPEQRPIEGGGHPADRGPGLGPDHDAGRAAGQATHRNAGESPDSAAGRSAGPDADHPSDRAAGKGPDHDAGAAAGQGGGRPTDRGPGQDRNAGLDPGRPTGPAPGLQAGLGLQIAQAVMALHGGRLTIDSAPGKGARVRLAFPTQPVARPGTARAPQFHAGAGPG